MNNSVLGSVQFGMNYEINSKARIELSKVIGYENIYNGSIFNYYVNKQFDVYLKEKLICL